VRRLGVAILAGLALAGCGGEPRAVAPGDPDPARGRNVYLAQCTACHNLDPGRPGPAAPPVLGSSRELLRAKVVHGTYPPGYHPKRDTAVMQPMPAIAPALDDLAAYLNP
jgi:mono/diheme cytochrome c family protein